MLKSLAHFSAFSLTGSKIPITSKPAFLYAGRCASLTIPPAPIITKGKAFLGIGNKVERFEISDDENSAIKYCN